MSLLQSALRRQSAGGGGGGNNVEDSVSSQASTDMPGSKSSLDSCFSPGLCSTQLMDHSTRTRKDDLPPETDDIIRPGLIISKDVKQTEIVCQSEDIMNVTVETSVMQNKILHYRRVLETVKSKLPRRRAAVQPPSDPAPTPQFIQEQPAADAKPQSPKKAGSKVESLAAAAGKAEPSLGGGKAGSEVDLLGVWTQARHNISPRTSPVERSKSRLSALCLTPYQLKGVEAEGASPCLINKHLLNIDAQETMVTNRLDALMDSLTLSDSSLDITIGRMSFGEDLQLSPHCP